ncbi:hypothetical protein BJF78_30870 [Pseudonocardia sp. CNS-139]|nr:hypothetical protein BJF78_30870 [Pseudonocardia sp. CNS-139]
MRDVDLSEPVAWLDAHLAAAGIVRTGALTVPRVRPWGSVLTAPTGAGPVWFKIPGPHTRYEVPLYGVLGRVVPAYVPRVLAVDVDRGWLLLAHGGTPLPPDALVAALPRYAELQRALAPHVDALLGAGVPDMRPHRMPDHFDEALAAVARRAESTADRETVARLGALRGTFAQWCARLAGSPVPTSLDHNDLHDRNVLTGPDGRAVFYDWGDSVVAHPFASMLVALDRLPSTTVPAARAAYLGGFADLAPPDRLAADLTLARRVAVPARVLTWERALGPDAGRFARASLETFAGLLSSPR